MPEESGRGEGVERKLFEAESRIEAAKAALYSPITPDAVRAHVTKLVVWAYVVFLFGAAAYFGFGGNFSDPIRISNIFELIKTAFLPVVAFVIGHYFGSKSS